MERYIVSYGCRCLLDVFLKSSELGDWYHHRAVAEAVEPLCTVEPASTKQGFGIQTQLELSHAFITFRIRNRIPSGLGGDGVGRLVDLSEW